MSNVLDSTNGFVVHGWMVTELGLKGPELTTYAIVHQFSQSKAGIYKGGVPYIMAWLGCSDVSARKYLHSLEQKGLVRSFDGDINGVPFRDYQVLDNHIPKIFGDTPKILGGDTQDFCPGTPKNFGVDNKRDNKEIIKEKDFLEKEKVILELFFRNLRKPGEECDKLIAYNSGPNVRKKWDRLNLEERVALAKIWRQEPQQPDRFDGDFLDSMLLLYDAIVSAGAPVAIRQAILDDKLRYAADGDTFVFHVREELKDYLEYNMSTLLPILLHMVRSKGCEKLKYQIIPSR